MRKGWKWLIAAVLVVLCVFGVELFAQLGALSAARPGVVTVTADQVEGAEGEDTYIGFYEGETTLTIPWEGYCGTIRMAGELYSDDPYSVKVTWQDGSTSTIKTDFASMSGVDYAHIGGNAAELQIKLPGGGEITSLTVDNDFRVNPYRALLTGLTALAIALLVLLRKTIARKAEIGFLIVGLCAGIAMVCCLPANTGLSYDDGIHYGRILLLSQGDHGDVTASPMEPQENAWNIVRKESFIHDCDTWQDEVAFNQTIDKAFAEGRVTETSGTVQWQFSDIGYLTQAAGFGLARLFGLPLHLQMKAAVLFNLLTYICLCYFAVRALKRFKLVMASAALLPTALFMASNFSYDPTINGFCFLGIALAVDAILDRNTLLTWQRGLGILLALTIGGLPKVVYLPLLLLVLLLPRSKFQSKAPRLLYKITAVLILLLGIGSMAISVNQGAVALTDTRGAGTDAMEQVRWILQHPFVYLGIFLRTMWEEGESYFLNSSRLSLGYLGSVGTPYGILSLGLILFTAFTDNDPELGQRLDWQKRLAMLIIAMLTVGLTFTTMYTAFCAVGATHYSGVQGRYLIPVLPLLGMLLSPDGIQNRMNKTGWHLTFYGMELFLLTAITYLYVFIPYAK